MASATASSASGLQGAIDAVEQLLNEVSFGSLCAALERWGCPPPFGRFVVAGADTNPEGGVSVLLHDSADRAPDPWPFRARAIQQWGRWAVVDILAQCATCFGSGELGAEGEPCDTCGGSGWGVA